MTLAVVVQARFASTRLRGKVLLEIGGRTILSRALERCFAIPGNDAVVCAVPDSPDSDPVAEEAVRCGAQVFRGSESDVLARYHGAAASVGADEVVRVTSDCPLIDPDVCGDVIALRRERGARYASNNVQATWPHGLDCEAFTFDALCDANSNACEPFEREHVTPFIRRIADLANLECPLPDVAKHRWTLDTQDDLKFFQGLLPRVDEVGDMSWQSVLRILDKHPELSAINSSNSR